MLQVTETKKHWSNIRCHVRYLCCMLRPCLHPLLLSLLPVEYTQESLITKGGAAPAPAPASTKGGMKGGAAPAPAPTSTRDLHMHQPRKERRAHCHYISACYKRQHLTPILEVSSFSAACKCPRSLVACKHSMTPPVHWPFSRPPTSRELPRIYLMTAPTHAACVKACIIQKHEINNPHACISSRIDDV